MRGEKRDRKNISSSFRQKRDKRSDHEGNHRSHPSDLRAEQKMNKGEDYPQQQQQRVARVAELIAASTRQTGRIGFSLEVFPPRSAEALAKFSASTLPNLAALGPAFIDVTYGAGGGGGAREVTLSICEDIQVRESSPPFLSSLRWFPNFGR